MKYPIFYFSSASSALFLPMLFRHCVLKALINPASDWPSCTQQRVQRWDTFPKPLWTMFVTYIYAKMSRRQRMGNRWKLKLERYNIHKMQWPRIHQPLSQSVSQSLHLCPHAEQPWVFSSFLLQVTAAGWLPQWPTPRLVSSMQVTPLNCISCHSRVIQQIEKNILSTIDIL